MELSDHIRRLEQRESQFEEAAASFGLPFEPEESSPRSCRREGCWSCENSGASLHRGWISPACLACRTGERTETFFVSLKCPRKCFFCFNPNQEDYERYCSQKRDIAREICRAYAAGKRYEHLAITGGEPFLHPEEVFSFLICARELYPEAYTRIYTSGDGLDESLCEELAQVGLSELRFSVKLDDPPQRHERLFALMKKAAEVLPAVMVEMPVIPGSRAQMEELLLRLDAIGVKGINLLELGFPLWNEEEFARRGLRLRKRPYLYPYNYWYAGGIPVAGSEGEALDLLRFASERHVSMGVHYCSADNKNTGQLYQQNTPFRLDASVRSRFGYLAYNDDTFLLEALTVFGSAARDLFRAWERNGIISSRWLYDTKEERLLFHPELADAARALQPAADYALNYFVLDREDGEMVLHELACEPISSGMERFQAR